MVDIAIDHGVNLIDTANVYSAANRRSRWSGPEGQVEADHRRQQGALPHGQGPNEQGNSRWHIINQCEASLKRLKPRPHRHLLPA